MSVYEISRFCHSIGADPAQRAAALADLPAALDGFELVPEEREAILRGDVGLLLRHGVHPVLLVRLCTYGVAGLTESSYSERVRAAGSDLLSEQAR